ncbi:hypothetical protein PACTADRAFT_49181 [Pachysolen tannophilus NRRL Y-2460]|uniref:Required for respiratory growth protein 9, mitochondrial n=1 Tax=Pachysolen tannophilus NRRL Y-2460 TaxID=669874 RepID=A0A1E4U0D7_PACTA|nr:hypothetical protein PACTADRAFT_49181 [Pachysolen tannophilus NRRL Y-2460]
MNRNNLVSWCRVCCCEFRFLRAGRSFHTNVIAKSQEEFLEDFCDDELIKSKKRVKNSWVLPKIVEDNEDQVKGKQVNGKFSVINHGTSVPKNWRSIESLPSWKRQKFALKEKFGSERWNPQKKLSREAQNMIRSLNKNYPNLKVEYFAEKFQMSPEAIRRILKSKWQPTEIEENSILMRWQKRGELQLKSKLVDKITKDYISEKEKNLQQLTNEQNDDGVKVVLDINEEKIKKKFLKNIKR